LSAVAMTVSTGGVRIATAHQRRPMRHLFALVTGVIMLTLAFDIRGTANEIHGSARSVRRAPSTEPAPQP
jgi:hypothetical protein